MMSAKDIVKKTLGDSGAPKIKKLLYMDAHFADSLEVCANLEGVSQSEILRRALAAYFAGFDRGKVKRFTEKAKALDRFK
jgi:hypothetical protein